MLRVWKCMKCGEELFYDDDSIKKVFCRHNHRMRVVHKGYLSEQGRKKINKLYNKKKNYA